MAIPKELTYEIKGKVVRLHRDIVLNQRTGKRKPRTPHGFGKTDLEIAKIVVGLMMVDAEKELAELIGKTWPRRR